ncbi:hypothetical protein CsatA_003999 [Cannabis sativa]
MLTELCSPLIFGVIKNVSLLTNRSKAMGVPTMRSLIDKADFNYCNTAQLLF